MITDWICIFIAQLSEQDFQGFCAICNLTITCQLPVILTYSVITIKLQLSWLRSTDEELMLKIFNLNCTIRSVIRHVLRRIIRRVIRRVIRSVIRRIIRCVRRRVILRSWPDSSQWLGCEWSRLTRHVWGERCPQSSMSGSACCGAMSATDPTQSGTQQHCAHS